MTASVGVGKNIFCMSSSVRSGISAMIGRSKMQIHALTDERILKNS